MEFKNDITKYPKNTLVIEYPFHVGGQFADRSFWMGTLNGEVLDYHLKENLIKQAKKLKINWVVLRWKKGKPLRKVIIQSSKSRTKKERKR